MKKKLKIGIFLNSNIKLQDGHIKIISELINSDFTKLECVFYYNVKKKLARCQQINGEIYGIPSYIM